MFCYVTQPGLKAQKKTACWTLKMFVAERPTAFPVRPLVASILRVEQCWGLYSHFNRISATTWFQSVCSCSFPRYKHANYEYTGNTVVRFVLL